MTKRSSFSFRFLTKWGILFAFIIFFGYRAGGVELLDRVIATVNDSVITQRQLDRKIEELSRLFAMREGPTHGVIPPPDALRRQALEQLINEEILLQRWAGTFKKSVAERLAQRAVDEQIGDLKEQLGEDELQSRLAKENQTLKEFRSMLIAQRKRQFLVQQSRQAWIDEFLLTPVSEARIEEYLQEHPELKTKAGAMLVRLILIRVPKDADEIKGEAIRRKAERVLNKARIGKPFEELVETYSEHEPSKAKGGLYTLESPSIPFPEFAPVFEAKVGQVYPHLIRIPAGWCIVKVVNKKNLHNLVRRAIAEEEFEKALKEERDKAIIVYDREMFRTPIQ